MIRDGLTDAMQGKVIALLFVEFLSSSTKCVSNT